MKLPVINGEMAIRIHQSEVDFFTSRMNSIGEREGNPEGVEIKKFGHATASYIKTMPWGLFNAVKGITTEDIDHVEEIVEFYRVRKRIFQLEIDPIHSSPQLLHKCAELGLYQHSFHSVLYGLPSTELPIAPSNIRIIEVVNEQEFDEYAEIHCIGSGMSIADKPHFVNNNIGLLNRPGWKIYLAYLNDIPAAVAVMHLNNETTSLTLATTVPQYRQQGLQTALLHKRMHEAYKGNCDLVVAQAGFGSTSQHNMERIGLQMAWTRAIWVPFD
ncbi:GNAT family N-acetyltransferase [Paenibacillus sp. FA6]|uniref:GNAT family N-acetyltransferase n=1 Tax=Paenibacillus sp. FA6 TaxID=3413029 RepID=UPI003F655200